MADEEHNASTPDPESGIEERDQSTSGSGDARTSGRRPRSVYIVLAVGVVALLSLLLIIYFSSDRDAPEQPICTTVDIGDAREAVLEGRITRITLAYDDAVTPPSADTWGPVLARLDYSDGQCANLPQGIINQDDIYLLLGAITAFNDITENTQVEIRYDRSTELQPGLFVTPTVPPSPTPEATETPQPAPTSSPEVGPEVTPTITSDEDEPIGPVLLPDSGTPSASPEATTR